MHTKLFSIRFHAVASTPLLVPWEMHSQQLGSWNPIRNTLLCPHVYSNVSVPRMQIAALHGPQTNLAPILVSPWIGCASDARLGMNFAEQWTSPINDLTWLASLGGCASRIAETFSSLFPRIYSPLSQLGSEKGEFWRCKLTLFSSKDQANLRQYNKNHKKPLVVLFRFFTINNV